MELGHVGTEDKQTRSSDQWLSVHFLTWEGKKSPLIQIKRDRSRQGSLVPNQSTTLTASDNRGQSGKLKKPCRHEGALGHPTWNVASGLHLGRALYWVFPSPSIQFRLLWMAELWPQVLDSFLTSPEFTAQHTMPCSPQSWNPCSSSILSPLRIQQGLLTASHISQNFPTPHI